MSSSVESDELSESEYTQKLLAYRLPSRILPTLYLGERSHATSRITTPLGITHILNVDTSCRFEEEAKYELCHQPLSDYGETDLATFLPPCFSFLTKAMNENGIILIHCRQGINRSPTVTIAFLMYVHKWSLARAYRHVTSIRTQASPHESYFTQLCALEKKWTGINTLTREEIGPSLQEVLRRLRKEAQEEEEKDS